MSSSSPPVITFELGVGEFRVVTNEAVYQLRVCPDLMDSAPVAGKAVTAAEEPGGFFQDLSEELFEKVGRLARQLSTSVEDLPGQIAPANLDETDQQLESAKGQLEEIVKITEEASMTIMDRADQIHDAMDGLKNHLGLLNSLDLTVIPETDEQPPAVVEAGGDSSQAQAEFWAKFNELKAYVEDLKAAASSAAPVADDDLDVPGDLEIPAEMLSLEPEAMEPEPLPETQPEEPAAAAVQTVQVTRFDIDVVFQTLYELCTNESVKDHIKRMREEKESAFNGPEIEANLSEMAPTVDEEDGFYNFPIPAVLKTLYGATESEDFRTILKKMNQTAASIFLDSVLPIEGEVVEAPAPAEAPPPVVEPEIMKEAEPAIEPEEIVPETPETEAAAGPGAEETVQAGAVPAKELQTVLELLEELEKKGRAAAAAQAASSGAAPGTYTSILTKDRDTIVTAVDQAQKLVQETDGHLTRILEALSFQDLSGQRIKKVVSLIGDVQMQLLSILVSVDAKLKVHKTNGGVGAKSAQTEKMAQEEVDRALERIAAGTPSDLLGPGADARLDQDAVNDLLANMGF